MKRLGRFLKKNWHWLFFACVVVLTLYMDVFVARTLLDGDISEHMLHGRIISENNNPFTGELYFTTEVRALDVPSAMAVFFYFTQNWTVVRLLTIISLQTYLILAFWFLCKQSGISRRAVVISSAWILLPFSSPYARLVLYHLHYILYVGKSFWMIGLTLLILGRRGRKNVVPACVLGAMWIVAGLNGIRYMLILGVPMLAYAVFRLLKKLTQYRFENGRISSDREFLPWISTEEHRLTAILFLSFLFWLVGFVIYSKVLIPSYEMYDMATSWYEPGMSAEDYADRLNGWLTAMGLRNSSLSVVGPRGLSLASAMFGFGYLYTVSFRSLRREEALEQNMTKSLLMVSMATSTLIFLFDRWGRFYTQYYVPVLVLAFPLLAHELDLLKEKAVSVCRKLLILLCCACFLYQGLYTIYFIRFDQRKLDQWTGLPPTSMRMARNAQNYAYAMQDAGYTHGLINYWHAATMMEVTNGEVTVGPLAAYVDDTGSLRLELSHWGTSRSLFQRENLPEEIVIFFDAKSHELFMTHYPHAAQIYGDGSVNGYVVSRDDLSY